MKGNRKPFDIAFEFYVISEDLTYNELCVRLSSSATFIDGTHHMFKGSFLWTKSSAFEQSIQHTNMKFVNKVIL